MAPSYRRIAIFLPHETPFYRALLGQMRRGFEAEGVATSGLCRHLGPDDMAAFCAATQPDVIFEMNRPRSDAAFVPRDIKHICWVVDFGGRPIGHFQGSDITYLFGLTWPAQYPHRGFHRWFGPGACDSDYAIAVAAATGSETVDAAFAGHIPRPWSDVELARDLTGGRGALSFGDLLPELERRLRAARGRLYTAQDFVDIASDVAAARAACPLVLDEKLRYDISGRTVRQLNRSDLVDATLGATRSLALYGPDSWAAWPRYAPFYRGFVADPAALRSVYRSARITLHEGNGIHFRSMDCMCAGGLLFFRSTAHDEQPGGIGSLFEPGVHYVPFELDALPEQIAAVLADPTRADRIRAAAAAAIRAGHTWRHRAREVLRDLHRL